MWVLASLYSTHRLADHSDAGRERLGVIGLSEPTP